MVFRHRLEVRFRDCDPLGHINNAAYFTYFEQTRFHHWRSLGIDLRHRPPGAPGFILARAECDFEAQASYGDELEVRLSVATVGRTSFTYTYELVKVATGERIASAKSVQVCFDYEGQRPVEIPPVLRDQLERAARGEPPQTAT